MRILRCLCLLGIVLAAGNASSVNVHGVYLDGQSGAWLLCSGTQGSTWQAVQQLSNPRVSGEIEEGSFAIRPLEEFRVARRILFILDTRTARVAMPFGSFESNLYQGMFNGLNFSSSDEVGIITFGRGLGPDQRPDAVPDAYVRTLLRPTSERNKIFEAILDYERAVYASDYTVEALRAAATMLQRPEPNATHRDVIVLVMHRMPDARVSLQEIQPLLTRQGQAIPVFAVVANRQESIPTNWQNFFRQTGGDVITVEQRESGHLVAGVEQALRRHDHFQGWLYARNVSTDFQDIRRSLNVQYTTLDTRARMAVNISYRDRRDALMRRVEQQLREKAGQVSGLDESIKARLRELPGAWVEGNPGIIESELSRIAADLDAMREAVQGLRHYAGAEESAANEVLVRREQQSYAEHRQAHDEQSALFARVRDAERALQAGQVNEAVSKYEQIAESPLLPLAAQARYLLICAEHARDQERFFRRAVAVIDHARMARHVVPESLMVGYCNALLHIGRHADAEREALELLARGRAVDRAALNFIISVSMYRQGQMNEAAMYLQRAIEGNAAYRRLFEEAIR